MDSWVRLAPRPDRVLLMQLDRPKANAIDIAFSEELEATFARLEEDDSFDALVVTGTGVVFSAGLDLKALPGYTVEEQDRLIRSLNRLLVRFYGFARPVVGAINGHAIAGGMVLLLACDYRVGTSSTEAMFGLSEARVGVAFPLGAREVVMTELARPVARRLMLTGATWGPEQALRDGALDETVAQDEVLPRALELAAAMGKLPSRSYAQIKDQVRGGTVARIREAAESGRDPLLGGWMDPEGRDSSSGILK